MNARRAWIWLLGLGIGVAWYESSPVTPLSLRQSHREALVELEAVIPSFGADQALWLLFFSGPARLVVSRNGTPLFQENLSAGDARFEWRKVGVASEPGRWNFGFEALPQMAGAMPRVVAPWLFAAPVAMPAEEVAYHLRWAPYRRWILASMAALLAGLYLLARSAVRHRRWGRIHRRSQLTLLGAVTGAALLGVIHYSIVAGPSAPVDSVLGYPLRTPLAPWVGHRPIQSWNYNNGSLPQMVESALQWLKAGRQLASPGHPEVQGTLPIEVYLGDAVETSPRRAFFGGLLSRVQQKSQRAVVLWLVTLALGLALLHRLLPRARTRTVCGATLALTAAASVVASLKLSRGYDEFYSNLSHAKHLAEHFSFSLNPESFIEATVDLVPYFLTGVLAKLGAPLEETALSLCLLGNVWLVVITFLILRRMTASTFYAHLGAVAVGLFPCVLYVGATGLPMALFSALILSLFYCRYVAPERRRWADRFAAALPLFRLEGLLMTGLFLLESSLSEFREKAGKGDSRARVLAALWRRACLVLTPTFLLCALRMALTGNPLPPTIYYKSSSLDWGYLDGGARQLYQTALRFELLPLLWILGMGLWWLSPAFSRRWNVGRFVGLVALFAMPYFIGGGDWFPWLMNRYLMPATLALVVAVLAVLYALSSRAARRWKEIASVGSGAFLAVWILGLYQPTDRFRHSNAYWHAWRGLAESDTDGWERIDRLASFGAFLGRTLPAQALIATPELATVPFFAERRVLDLLGIGNPEIALTPLDPLFPGNHFHRRRNPNTLVRHQPDALAFFEMAFWAPSLPSSLEQVAFQQTQTLTPYMIDVAYYQAGSFLKLKTLGYRRLAVYSRDKLFVYFIHERVLPFHLERLKEQGYQKLGTLELPYRVSPFVARRFSP